MGVKEVAEAWKRFKFPVYKVGDLLYSEKTHKIYEVRYIYYNQPGDIDKYDIIETGRDYKGFEVNMAELLFKRLRKATPTEVLLYG